MLLRGVGDTYGVETSGGKYILRAYRRTHRSLPQVQEEIDYLLALQAAGVTVSYPIADRGGKHIRQPDAPEGVRCVVLFSFADGQPLSTLNENQLRELGRQMAAMHHVAAEMPLTGHRWTYDLHTTLFQPIEMLRPFFKEDPDGLAWLVQAAKDVKRKLDLLGTGDFAYGCCHYDLLNKNFHCKGDKVTFFDFDFLGYGWLVNDLMTFWVQLCLDVLLGRLTQEAADAAYHTVIKAYREVRPLSDKELAAVPYLALGFWVFYSGFHTTHDQFYLFLQPAQLKQRFGMVRRMLEKYWK